MQRDQQDMFCVARSQQTCPQDGPSAQVKGTPRLDVNLVSNDFFASTAARDTLNGVNADFAAAAVEDIDALHGAWLRRLPNLAVLS